MTRYGIHPAMSPQLHCKSNGQHIFNLLLFIGGKGVYRVLVGKPEVKRPLGYNWQRCGTASTSKIS
jgi:hypothetical protein